MKQLLRPVPLLNVPFPQGLHADPLEAPTAELAVPIAHRAHTLEPLEVVYVPAAQALHWDPACPPAKEPGWHAAHAVWPGMFDIAPDEHPTHCVALTMPGVLPNVPAPQSWHTDAPP